MQENVFQQARLSYQKFEGSATRESCPVSSDLQSFKFGTSELYREKIIETEEEERARMTPAFNERLKDSYSNIAIGGAAGGQRTIQ